MSFKRLLKPYSLNMKSYKGGIEVRFNGGLELFTDEELSRIIEELDSLQRAMVLFIRTKRK